jgi:hypothetical protein
MQINVSGNAYRVEIARTAIVIDGLCRDAAIDYHARRIRISPDAPRDQRKRLLMHELAHAIVYHRGAIPRDEEEHAVVFEAAAALGDQIDAQGGTAALMSMEPPAATEATGSGVIYLDRVTCPVCDATIMIGSIEQGPAAIDPELGRPVAERSMQCDACGRKTRWREVVTASGLPTGVYLPGVVVKCAAADSR